MKTDRDRIERLEERVRNMMAAMRELQRQIAAMSRSREARDHDT